jgi:hypothetical protein
MDQSRLRGSTRFWKEDLSSPVPLKGPSSVIFHIDGIEG